jgi:hypothetical protein
MADVAKKITQIGSPEQVSEPKTDEKPWLRQKKEPAIWFWRFKRYLEMGSKRSLRAVVASEPSDGKATKGDKNQTKKAEGVSLSSLSVPGAWSRAAKVWNWKARADAYDLAELGEQSRIIHKMASSLPFASKSYRLIQLNYLAMILRSLFEPGTPITTGNLNIYLAAMARYQSVMHDIEALVEGLDGITKEACDAAALESISKEIADRKAKKG